MAVRDITTLVTNTRVKGRRATSGKYTVAYIDAKGRSLSATVLGAGTASGLKLSVKSYGTSKVVDNISAMVNANDTGVYVLRDS